MKHEPALDGMRGLAVLAVVAVHTHVPGITGGARGVDVFFVLSGYLITTILRDEAEAGGIDVGRFLLRRAARLMPALLAFLATYLALAPRLFPEFAGSAGRDVLLAGAYLTDYGLAALHEPSPIAHTWSLGVEEKFYLVWPFVLHWLLARKAPVRLLLIGWAATTLLRVTILAKTLNFDDAYYPFHVHATGLILGAVVALSPQFPARLGWVGLGLLAFLLVVENPADGGISAILWSIPLAEIATALVIAAVAGTPSLRAALSSPPLVGLGVISYGVYLWHPAIEYLMRPYPWWVGAAVTLASSIVIAALSYWTVEWPARAWRLHRRSRLAIS